MRAAPHFFLLAMVGLNQFAVAQNRVVLAVSTVLDGKGKVLHDTRIVVYASKIVAIDPKASPIDYDLRGLTVMPGWIDAHVHITSSFGPDGKSAGMGAATSEAAISHCRECLRYAARRFHYDPEYGRRRSTSRRDFSRWAASATDRVYRRAARRPRRADWDTGRSPHLRA
jgi:predicted amidohydrolase YtcJ